MIKIVFVIHEDKEELFTHVVRTAFNEEKYPGTRIQFFGQWQPAIASNIAMMSADYVFVSVPKTKLDTEFVQEFSKCLRLVGLLKFGQIPIASKRYWRYKSYTGYHLPNLQKL